MTAKYTPQQYFFRLGRHPLLALAELVNILKIKGYQYKILLRFEEGVILEIAQPDSKVAELQDTLGGTIKIIRIIDRFSGKLFDLDKHIAPDHLVKEYFQIKKDKKINYGLSTYGDPELTASEANWIGNWVRQIKQHLALKHSVRFVESEVLDLNSATISKNQLLTTGAELVLIRTINDKIRSQSDFYFGKTISVQDWQAYATRDFEKPSADPVSGMLPPKLAQMMINICRTPNTTTIYDPFVGNGAILQEAILLNMRVYGSDISETAVTSSIENIKWAYRYLMKKEARLTGHFEVADATNVEWPTLNQSATAIVAEPYLGPPQRKPLRPNEAKPIVKELTDLYLAFFTNLNTNFKKVPRVGIVLPVFKTTEGLQYIDLITELAKMGWHKFDILPKEAIKAEQQISRRGGFLYSRPDQVVLREFFVFEKK